MKKKNLDLKKLFLDHYPKLRAIARKHKPDSPETLVSEAYIRLRERMSKGNAPVFEYEGAFINFMKIELFGYVRKNRDKDGDWREIDHQNEEWLEEQAKNPDSPVLKDVMNNLRTLPPSMNEPEETSNIPGWTSTKRFEEAHERTINELVAAFNNGETLRARGLVSLFRKTLDPVWDAYFKDTYPDHYPVSVTLSKGLDAALEDALFQQPMASSRKHLQKTCQTAGLNYVPYRIGDVDRADFDLKEQFIVNYMTAAVYLQNLTGKERFYAQAVIFKHVDGMTLEQISERMDIPISRVMRYIDLGLDNLRNAFAFERYKKQESTE